MITKKQGYRHGEITLVKIVTLPEGLTPSKSKILMIGSSGNHHSFDKGTFYPKKENEFVFGYFTAKNTTLLHPEHGDKGKAKIDDGFYQLIKQQEHTPEGLIPVQD